MVDETEGTFVLSDGTELYEKTWKPDDQPNAHLIFLHGFSDHVNAYYQLFPTLASPPYNITVHGIDQRGWGRSCAKASSPKSARGLTGPTTQVIKDVDEYVQHVSSQINSSPFPAPLFLMGHSMGGGEAVYYMLTRDKTSSPPISGLIVESPFIEFHSSAAPSAIMVTAGRFASRLRPKMQMKQQLNAQIMSRDPAVVKAWVDDPLCHDTGTLEGLAGLLSRTAELASVAKGQNVAGLVASSDGKVAVGCPVLWTHGTGDMICDFNTSKALYDRVTSEDPAAAAAAAAGLSRCHWYPDAYHKIHAEPDGVGEQFAKDVGEWICEISRHSVGEQRPAAKEDDTVKPRL